MASGGGYPAWCWACDVQGATCLCCIGFPPATRRYVQFTKRHFMSQGQQPPDEMTIRAHYRQQRQQLEAGGIL